MAAAPDVVEDGTSLGWQYTRKAIAFMKHVAQREGATLLVVPITYRSPHHAALVRAIARDLDLPFLDAAPLAPRSRELAARRRPLLADGSAADGGDGGRPPAQHEHRDRRTRLTLSPGGAPLAAARREAAA